MKIDQSICNDWTLSPLKNCLEACGLKTKIASERRASLCAGVFLPCIYTSFRPCVFSASAGALFFCPACTCVLCPTRSPSVCIREPSSPRQIPGIHTSWQWKTDNQASSCHTSIPPRAPRDSLQHAFTHSRVAAKQNIRLLPVGSFSHVAGKRGSGDVCRVVSSVVQLCSLWISSLPSCHTEWNSLPHTVLNISCGVLSVTVSVFFFLPVFVCASVYTSPCVVMSESVWLCRGIGGKTAMKRFASKLDLQGSNAKKQWI